MIHAAIGYGIYLSLSSGTGKQFFQALVTYNTPKPVIKSLPNIIENVPVKTADETKIPPFDVAGLTSISKDNTFANQKSGLLFADEINLPNEKKTQVAGKKIVLPQIHREFTLDALPRQYRDRNWDLTLKVRVSKNGIPDQNIRITKSSGDKVLDQLTMNRVKKSNFEPAHYEGSTEYFDYTFDMQIHYR